MFWAVHNVCTFMETHKGHSHPPGGWLSLERSLSNLSKVCENQRKWQIRSSRNLCGLQTVKRCNSWTMTLWLWEKKALYIAPPSGSHRNRIMSPLSTAQDGYLSTRDTWATNRQLMPVLKLIRFYACPESMCVCVSRSSSSLCSCFSPRFARQRKHGNHTSCGVVKMNSDSS